MGLLMTIDNGGTFTDACLINKDRVISTKSLTTPYDLTKCFVDVIKKGSKELYGKEDIRTILTEIDYLRYSTTAGTNAIVQKKGPRVGLIMRERTDPSILQASSEEREMFSIIVEDRIAGLDLDADESMLEGNVVEAVNQLLSQGVERIVVSLSEPSLVSDENKIKNIILRKYPRHLLGAVPILISHELVDDKDDRRRTWGALINSFLHPGMENFLYNAENVLRDHRTKNPLLIFQNDGNSARVAKTTAIKSYGSGPRGGMEGAKALAEQYNISGMLTLDIGGTTSDAGLVKRGEVKEERYGKVESIQTSFSLSDLISVGAGGSSIFTVTDGKIAVGPESVGAAPGPACFSRGGKEATITDANLLMGILDSRSYFGGSMVLDESRAREVIEKNVAAPLGVSLEEALILMEQAYEEKIAQGISPYQTQVDDATLLAFGGAGPMSACGVAESAGIKNVIIPRQAAIFSAFGISFSDIAHDYQANITEVSTSTIEEKMDLLMERATKDMFAEGFDLSECKIQTYLNFSQNGKYETVIFDNPHSLKLKEKTMEDIHLHVKVEKPIEHFELEEKSKLNKQQPTPSYEKTILNSQRKTSDIPVYHFDDLQPGTIGEGPALIEDEFFTSRVLDGWTFRINENSDIFLQNEEAK
ncbi:hydantoinase/oxoprolinase family protein [Bacillus piscicola]|uniref:hydantoinase/oxoprolinase family protein n=1 Tax=Bacillus piscicola TaxID=1632684 RepID=UPI001F0926AF|nr:hydantoinase/oxoprolinase family protein [Bacillus piscicola]